MRPDLDLLTFRIRPARGRWRVETWCAEPPFGPAWQPALTGALTVDEAREFFDTATVIEWDENRLGGRYTFSRGAA